MASFPNLSWGSVALYPLTETTRMATAVLTFSDFTEKRWRRGPKLKAFVMALEAIGLADVGTIRAFFDGRKGGFDSTWDITIGTDNYQNMTFINDTLEFVERDGAYFGNIQIRQVRA